MRSIVVILAAGFAFADASPRRGLVDPAKLRLDRVIDAGDEYVFAAASAADGRLLAAGRRDGKIALWDTAREGGPRLIEGHTGYVYAVTFDRDAKRLASAGRDGTIRLWTLEPPRCERVLTGHEGPIQSLAFASGGSLVIGGGADTACAWKLDGALVFTFAHGAPVTQVAAHGLRAATAGGDGVVRIWDLKTGKQFHALTGHEKAATAVSFSPDGSRVATGALDGAIRCWATGSGTQLWQRAGHPGPVNALAFAPDGAVIGSAGADGIRYWRSDGSERGATRVAKSTATGIAFPSSGTTVIATFADNRIRVWNARAAAPFAEPAVERVAGFLGVSYSSDGGALVGSVIEGSQAEGLGFQVGDLIVGVDAVDVKESDDFMNHMRGTFEGDEITLRVRREGRERFVRAKLGRWK